MKFVIGGDSLVVGNDDERQPVRMEGLEEPEHLQRGGTVEIASRLVGKKQ